jgi:ribosome-binding protein aMBF1 (putative translation factor)
MFMKTRKKNNTPKTHNSLILYSLMETISKEELQKTENKMRLAIKIADGIEAKGFKKYEFAKKINKNNLEIDKWLSGTHNFTVETLFFLQKELGIKLLDLDLNLEVLET